MPSTRQLVRRDRNGDGNVWGLATAVASDDIGGDGSIICSNGRSVFVLHVDGRVDPALSAPLAGEVIALRS